MLQGKRWLALIFLLAVTFVLPLRAGAQLAEFEEALSMLGQKLPTDVWDGQALYVTTWRELQKVRRFIAEFDKTTKVAKEALANMSEEERTDERTKAINDEIAWMNDVIAAFNVKHDILRPRAASPFLGPDVGQEKPFVVDTLGMQSTQLLLYNHRGPTKGGKELPYRYSIRAFFVVHYADVSPEDVVVLQPMKGAKKLGSPKVCSKKTVYEGGPLMLFECETHERDAEYKTLYDAAGDVEIKLTYRRVIEGKEFKNFASLLVRTVKQPQVGGHPTWGIDYDMELGPSVIVEKHSDARDGWADGAIFGEIVSFSMSTDTYVLIQTMFKDEGTRQTEQIACFYKGERIGEDKARSAHVGGSRELEMKKGNKWAQAVWRNKQFWLSHIHPRAPQKRVGGVHYLSENPGEYKCVITAGGDVLKELRFQVGGDGEIVKPPCQAKSMNAPQAVTLLSTTLKKPYPAKWNKQIAAKRGYGGGVTWAKGCPP